MYTSLQDIKNKNHRLSAMLSFWHKPRIKHFAKVVSLLITLSFVFPYLAWAFEKNTFPAGQGEILFNSQALAIPGKFGAVTKSHQGQDKLIVYIQDLHCHEEVQTNIAGIIDYLGRKYGLEMVGVEGAGSKIDVSKLSGFPQPKVKAEVGKYFMQQGKITGPEYYAAMGKHKIHLEGIETQKYYQANQEGVKRFLNNESQGYVYDLREMLEELKVRVYGKALSKHDQQRNRFREGEQSLLGYAVYLYQAGRRAGLDMEVFPHLGRYVSRRRNVLPVNVDSDALYTEMERVERELRLGLYRSEQEQELDDLHYRLDVMEKLVNISISPGELEAYRGQPEKFRVRGFRDFILSCEAGREVWLDNEVYRLDEYLKEAEIFYQVADQRSLCFVENTLDRMADYQTRLAVLVTGGYHSEEVLKELQRRDISYVCVKPDLRHSDIVNPYFSLLKNQRTPLEKLLAQNQNILSLATCFRTKLRTTAGVENILPENVRTFEKTLDLTLKLGLVVHLMREGVKGLAPLKQAYQDIVAAYRENNSRIGLDWDKVSLAGRMGFCPVTAGFTAVICPCGFQSRNKPLMTVALNKEYEIQMMNSAMAANMRSEVLRAGQGTGGVLTAEMLHLGWQGPMSALVLGGGVAMMAPGMGKKFQVGLGGMTRVWGNARQDINQWPGRVLLQAGKWRNNLSSFRLRPDLMRVTALGAGLTALGLVAVHPALWMQGIDGLVSAAFISPGESLSSDRVMKSLFMLPLIPSLQRVFNRGTPGPDLSRISKRREKKFKPAKRDKGLDELMTEIIPGITKDKSEFKFQMSEQMETKIRLIMAGLEISSEQVDVFIDFLKGEEDSDAAVFRMMTHINKGLCNYGYWIKDFGSRRIYSFKIDKEVERDYVKNQPLRFFQLIQIGRDIYPGLYDYTVGEPLEDSGLSVCYTDYLAHRAGVIFECLENSGSIEEYMYLDTKSEKTLNIANQLVKAEFEGKSEDEIYEMLLCSIEEHEVQHSFEILLNTPLLYDNEYFTSMEMNASIVEFISSDPRMGLLSLYKESKSDQGCRVFLNMLLDRHENGEEHSESWDFLDWRIKFRYETKEPEEAFEVLGQYMLEGGAAAGRDLQVKAQSIFSYFHRERYAEHGIEHLLPQPSIKIPGDEIKKLSGKERKELELVGEISATADEFIQHMQKQVIPALSSSENIRIMREFDHALQTAMAGGGRLYLVAAGRSGEAVEYFRAYCNEAGFHRVSMLSPTSLDTVREVGEHDLVLFVSGSGSTLSLLDAIMKIDRESRGKARLFGITADKNRVLNHKDLKPAWEKVEIIEIPASTKETTGVEKTRLYLGTGFELAVLFVATAIIRASERKQSMKELSEIVSGMMPELEYGLIRKLPRKQSAHLVQILTRAGRKHENVVVLGANRSSKVAELFKQRLNNIFINTINSFKDPEAFLQAEVLVVVSRSGETREVWEKVKQARSARGKKIKIILITSQNSLDSSIAKMADITIPLAVKMPEAEYLSVVETQLKGLMSRGDREKSSDFERMAAVYLDGVFAACMQELGLTEEAVRAGHAQDSSSLLKKVSAGPIKETGYILSMNIETLEETFSVRNEEVSQKANKIEFEGIYKLCKEIIHIGKSEIPRKIYLMAEGPTCSILKHFGMRLASRGFKDIIIVSPIEPVPVFQKGDIALAVSNLADTPAVKENIRIFREAGGEIFEIGAGEEKSEESRNRINIPAEDETQFNVLLDLLLEAVVENIGLPSAEKKEFDMKSKAYADSIMGKINKSWDRESLKSVLKLGGDIYQAYRNKHKIYILGTRRSGAVAEWLAGTLKKMGFLVGDMQTDILEKGQVVLAVSESGETDATLQDVRRAKQAGLKIWALTSAKATGSQLAALADESIFLQNIVSSRIGRLPSHSTFEITALALLANTLVQAEETQLRRDARSWREAIPVFSTKALKRKVKKFKPAEQSPTADRLMKTTIPKIANHLEYTETPLPENLQAEAVRLFQMLGVSADTVNPVLDYLQDKKGIKFEDVKPKRRIINQVLYEYGYYLYSQKYNNIPELYPFRIEKIVTRGKIHGQPLQFLQLTQIGRKIFPKLRGSFGLHLTDVEMGAGLSDPLRRLARQINQAIVSKSDAARAIKLNITDDSLLKIAHQLITEEFKEKPETEIFQSLMRSSEEHEFQHLIDYRLRVPETLRQIVNLKPGFNEFGTYGAQFIQSLPRFGLISIYWAALENRSSALFLLGLWDAHRQGLEKWSLREEYAADELDKAFAALGEYILSAGEPGVRDLQTKAKQIFDLVHREHYESQGYGNMLPTVQSSRFQKLSDLYKRVLDIGPRREITEHPKRPFSWQGSLQTVLGFLVSGPMLGGLVWLISGQPWAWADIMALPGMLFILSGSVLGAVVFGFLSWDASGKLSWLWKFLVSKGVCRAGPENLISGFKNAEPAEAGQENPAYTQGTTIYADKKFMSQRPKPIQWFYLLHEQIHVYFNSKKISFGAETLAYGGQALPLILLQIIGLGLAFNVMFGLAALPVLLAPALLFMLSRTRSQVEPAKKQFEEVRPNQPLRGKQPPGWQVLLYCLSGILYSPGLSQAGNIKARLPLEGLVSFFRGALLLVPGALWLRTITRKAGPGRQTGQTPDLQRLLVEIQADEAAVKIFARQGYGDFIRPNIQVRPCSDLGLISRLLSPLGRVRPDENGQPVIHMPDALLLNSRDPGMNFFLRMMLKYHLESFYSTSRVDTALTRLRVRHGWQQSVIDRIQQLALGPQGYITWMLKDDKSILAQQLLNKNSPAGQAYRQWLDTPDKDNTWKWMDLMLGEVEKPGDSPPALESLTALSKVCSRVPGLMGVIVGDMHGTLLTREQREIVLPAILLQTHSDRRFWLNRLEKLRLPLTLKRRELLPLRRQPARALDRAA